VVRIPAEARDVSLLQIVLTAAGIDPDTCVLSPAAKRAAFKFDHSPPSDAEIKNEWRYTSIPSHACIAFVVTMHLECLHFVLVLCAAVLTGRPSQNAQFLSPDAHSNIPLAISPALIEGPAGSAATCTAARCSLFAVRCSSGQCASLSYYCQLTFCLASFCLCFFPLEPYTAIQLLCLTIQFARRTIVNDEPRIANRYCVLAGGVVGWAQVGWGNGDRALHKGWNGFVIVSALIKDESLSRQ
jgi:hypothetical protein